MKLVRDTNDTNLFQENSVIDASLDIAGVNVKEFEEILDSDKSKLDKGKDLINKARSTADDVGNTVGALDKFFGTKATSAHSIVARARNSVLQFPVYVTAGLPMSITTILSKLIERVYATLVQTVLSQNQYINEDEANNLVFLKRFHTNLKESADFVINEYYESIDDLDQMLIESVSHSIQLSDTMSVDFSIIPPDNQDLIKENARLMHEPLTGLSYLKEDGDNRLTVKETKGERKEKQVITDDEFKKWAKDELDLDDEEKRILNMTKTAIDRSENDDEKKKKDELDDRINQKIIEIKQDIKDRKYNALEFKNGRYTRMTNSTTTGRETTILPPLTSLEKQRAMNDAVERRIDAPELLKDTDIKTINSLLPYTMKASFRVRNSNHEPIRDVTYVIGIKSVMHRISYQDLQDDIRELITGDIKSLRKVRYKTGELNFRDYWFNIKNIKADAARHASSSKRWLNTLKRLGEYEKFNGTFFGKGIGKMTDGKVPIPNGTLIITEPEANRILSTTGIDLNVVSNAKKLSKTLFLICIMIVDYTNSTMKVLFPDSDTKWDEQSLNSIEAELAKTDTTRIANEMSRIIK